MERAVPFAGTCPIGKLMTAKFPALLIDAMRPTGELAGVITTLVCALGERTVNAGWYSSFCQKQPAIKTAASKTIVVRMSFKTKSPRKFFFTSTETSESTRDCHPSFRGRHVSRHAVKEFEKCAQPRNRK